MKKITHFIAACLCFAIALTSGGCNQISQSQKPVTLTISAAASLKDSMDEIKKLYEAEKKNVKLNINYGSSGTLQTQIEQGADVDIFMSAAAKQMDSLSKKNLLIEDTKMNLLGNSVVLIVKSDSILTAGNFDLSFINKINKIALGDPKTVPAGQYGEEVCTKLNILNEVKKKAVYAKDVKEVLTWVETGNADAGVVYSTDAKTSNKVKVIATASKDLLTTPIVYPVAVIKSSKNASTAKEFLKYVSGSKGKKVFEKYGFEFLGK